MYYVTYFHKGFIATTNTEIVERLSEYNFVAFDNLESFMVEYAKRMSVVYPESDTSTDDTDEFVRSLVEHNVIGINEVN